MKYKKGDKFIYQIQGKSRSNGETVTVLSGSESDNKAMYYCKIGCCQRALMSEEKLDTFEIVPITPLNNV
jgi:hypothetical protein